MHGVVFDILVGSENRVGLAAVFPEMIAGWPAGPQLACSAARLRPTGFGVAAFATKWLAQPDRLRTGGVRSQIRTGLRKFYGN